MTVDTARSLALSRPEIWARVLYFVHRPIPQPLSGPPRERIRQGDLVKVMRTCSMLYQLALPLLYTTVITDDLNALLHAHPRSSCSGRISGKAQHLHRIKHLYLERTDKSAAWSMGSDETGVPHEYRAELVALHYAVTSPVFASPHGPFPNLETLALGAIYGPVDPALWTAFCRTKLDPTRGRLMRETADAMARLLRSPKLRHVCQRGGGGMLNFPAQIEEPPPSLPNVALTTHIRPGEDSWTIPFGIPCRWVLDPPFPAHSSHPSYTWKSLYKSITAALKQVSMMRPWTPDPSDQRFILDIYASASDPEDSFNRRADDALPPGWRWEGYTAAFWDCVEGKDLEKVVKAVRSGMAGFGADKDEIRWLPGRKAPRCEACGG